MSTLYGREGGGIPFPDGTVTVTAVSAAAAPSTVSRSAPASRSQEPETLRAGAAELERFVSALTLAPVNPGSASVKVSPESSAALSVNETSSCAGAPAEAPGSASARPESAPAGSIPVSGTSDTPPAAAAMAAVKPVALGARPAAGRPMPFDAASVKANGFPPATSPCGRTASVVLASTQLPSAPTSLPSEVAASNARAATSSPVKPGSTNCAVSLGAMSALSTSESVIALAEPAVRGWNETVGEDTRPTACTLAMRVGETWPRRPRPVSSGGERPQAARVHADREPPGSAGGLSAQPRRPRPPRGL